MLSTGNDIVAIKAINVTRTKQPNFYSKILTPAETALHSHPRFVAIPFEVFVWLLWSIKESAFKFLQRIEAEVLFTPVKFEVSEIHIPAEFKLLTFDKPELIGIGFAGFNPVEAVVKFGEHLLYSNSFISHEFINTVVNDSKDFAHIYWGVNRIDGNETEVQSAKVRRFLINSFPDKNVTVGKNQQGVPILLKDDIELPIAISLSHHECCIAYSFRLH